MAKQGVGVSMAKLPRRKCANKECRQWFHPVRDTQTACGYECASAVGKEQTRKAREDAKRKESAKQRATEKKERAAWSKEYLLIHARLKIETGQFIEKGGKDYKVVSPADYMDYGFCAVIAEETRLPLLVPTP